MCQWRDYEIAIKYCDFTHSPVYKFYVYNR